MREGKVNQPYTFLYCEECTQDQELMVPMEIVHGFIDALTKISWRMRADAHEQNTGHETVLVEPELEN